ncbi:hypothetical protein [Nocardioides sp. W7]|uniref:hypothetical protein n=1 Tax=Nocardioides sp. W7 TaxID=2931390 RepID=UPI001FD4C02B|nr:hypothetical protein [Nocardioides sp. W7]
MTETDRLRDLLEQTAPGTSELSPAERAHAVARRGRAVRRRRRRALACGGAAAALAVAVLVPLTLSGGDDAPDAAAPRPDPSAVPCPAGPIALPALPPALDGEIVSARACEAVDTLSGWSDEPLLSEAAEAFVADVQALPSYSLPAQCALMMVIPDPWVLVVERSGGEPAVIGSSMRSCSSVPIDGTDRGAGEVLAAFAGNLERQRTGTPPLACPDGRRLAQGAPTWNASFDLSAVTAGMVCYRIDPLGSREYAATEGKLDVESLATIRDDLVAHIGPPREETYSCVDTGPQRLLLLQDADGDLAAFVDDQCSGDFVSAHGTWTPGAAGEDAIADVLGGRVSG